MLAQIKQCARCISLCLFWVGRLAALPSDGAEGCSASQFELRCVRHPPSNTAIGVYWWWFGPSANHEEINSELNDLQAAGVGSVIIFPLYALKGTAAEKPFSIQSRRFQSEVGFAVREAHRRGITVALVGGSGWPYGGPSVSLADSAMKTRTVTQRLLTPLEPPRLEPGESIISKWLLKNTDDGVDLRQSKDVTTETVKEQENSAHLRDHSVAVWTLIATPTLMQVKRAAVGGEGRVVDHLQANAVQRYLDTLDPLFSGIGSKPDALHSDSLEVFEEEWTPTLLEEFRQRRGYDLREYLPALGNDVGSVTPYVRYDFWKTVSELATQNYAGLLQQWAHKRQVSLRAEHYGTPPVEMDAFRYADKIMGEGAAWKTATASRLASSAAHIFGHQTVSAEAFTWMTYPIRFDGTLEDLKSSADLFFLSGVNKLFAHGYAYSPEDTGNPGWTYYAGEVLGPKAPFWPFFPQFSKYIQRASYTLSRGKPVVEIAVYLPAEDQMATSPVGSGLRLNMREQSALNGKPSSEFGYQADRVMESPLLSAILRAGFGFDLIDESLIGELRGEGKDLVAGDAKYRVVILPPIHWISSSSLAHLHEFCRAGGILFAHESEAADNISGNATSRSSLVPVTTHNLQQICDSGDHLRLYKEAEDLKQDLKILGPDVAFSDPNLALGFAHRRTRQADLYFIANVTSVEQKQSVQFRDIAVNALKVDLETGEACGIGSRKRQMVDLQPYESTVYVFSRDHTVALAPCRTRVKLMVPRIPFSEWTFRFENQSERKLCKLSDWTSMPGLRYKTGEGVYTVTFDWDHRLRAHQRAILDLGEVHDTADVYLNGTLTARLWHRPFFVDVTRSLRTGRNTLSVHVTNRWVNQILGMDEINTPLDASQPLPSAQEKTVGSPRKSGLIGPVTLSIEIESPESEEPASTH